MPSRANRSTKMPIQTHPLFMALKPYWQQFEESLRYAEQSESLDEDADPEHIYQGAETVLAAIEESLRYAEQSESLDEDADPRTHYLWR